MSESIESSSRAVPDGPSTRRDLWCGIGLLLLAGFAVWALRSPSNQPALMFSLGALPLVFIVAAVVGGIGIIARGPLAGGPPVVQNLQDFWGAFGLILLAVLAWWASRALPGQQGFAFGPGTAPRLFILLLGISGIVIMAGSVMATGPMVHYSLISALVVLAIAAAWVGLNYVIGRASNYTVAPVVATAIVDVASLAGIRYIDRFGVRGPYFITLAVLSFAAFIRPIGLVITTFVLVIMSAAGSRETKWIEAIVWGAVLAAFCAVLFPYVLNLPMQLWPRF